jgi:hypothetical protein
MVTYDKPWPKEIKVHSKFYNETKCSRNAESHSADYIKKRCIQLLIIHVIIHI